MPLGAERDSAHLVVGYLKVAHYPRTWAPRAFEATPGWGHLPWAVRRAEFDRFEG